LNSFEFRNKSLQKAVEILEQQGTECDNIFEHIVSFSNKISWEIDSNAPPKVRNAQFENVADKIIEAMQKRKRYSPYYFAFQKTLSEKAQDPTDYDLLTILGKKDKDCAMAYCDLIFKECNNPNDKSERRNKQDLFIKMMQRHNLIPSFFFNLEKEIVDNKDFSRSAVSAIHKIVFNHDENKNLMGVDCQGIALILKCLQKWNRDPKVLDAGIKALTSLVRTNKCAEICIRLNGIEIIEGLNMKRSLNKSIESSIGKLLEKLNEVKSNQKKKKNGDSSPLNQYNGMPPLPFTSNRPTNPPRVLNLHPMTFRRDSDDNDDDHDDVDDDIIQSYFRNRRGSGIPALPWFMMQHGHFCDDD